jgi:hypothetical protein
MADSDSPIPTPYHYRPNARTACCRAAMLKVGGVGMGRWDFKKCSDPYESSLDVQ